MGRSSERRRLAREAQRQKEKENAERAEQQAESRRDWKRARIRDAVLCGIAIIVAMVTALPFWDSNRELAIAFVATVIAGSVSAELYVAKLHIVWPISFSIGTFGLAAGLYCIAGPALPLETETHGRLRAGNDPRTLQCTVPIPTNSVTMSVGGNAIYLPPQLGDFPVLRYLGKPVITLHRENEAVFASVSAYLKDKDGNPTAYIERNEFRINPSKSFREINKDRSELTIKSFDGEEMLHVKYMNPRLFFIRGHFYIDKGWELTITNDGLVVKHPTGSITKAGDCGGAILIDADGMVRFG